MNEVIPNPGTQEARNLGCSCPVLDNGHGKGWMGGVKDDDGETIYVYTIGCPVHAATLRAARKFLKENGNG